MRIVVVGASGNTGTAVLRRLARADGVSGITGIARRVPEGAAPAPYDVAEWHAVDIGAPTAVASLTDVFAGASAVIHLAWQIQPSHDRAALRRTNVIGTRQVTEAVVRASVPALVVASSVGAYAPADKDEPVTEQWPVTGVPGSTYSRDKADQEALLDEVQRDAPDLRMVRLRPGLIFQRSAATEIARYFIGPFAPLRLLHLGRLPAVPANSRLRVQAVHADDVAEAYVRAALAEVHGAFNIAADPVLDAERISGRYQGRPVPVPMLALRIGAELAWRARLQPTEPGWIRLAANAPVMSTERARSELGWQPRIDALDAFAELLDGMAHGAGAATPPLRPRRPVDLRVPGHGNPY